MSFKLTISKPCSENWNYMIPNQIGRYCEKCQTSVIDFTSLTDTEIQNFFLRNQNGVCGKFYKSQINRIEIHMPRYLLFKRMSSWKKFLLIFLVCFSSSVLNFDTEFQGTSLYAQTVSTKKYSKKSSKKRHRFKYVHSKKVYDCSVYETLGYTTMTYDSPTLPGTKGDTSDDKSEEKSGSYKNGVIYSQKEKSGKPNSNRQEPLNKLEFILPSKWIRRKLKKRTNKKYSC